VAALVRGVNVGGTNKLPMPELRAAVTALGGTDVVTLLNSGNVVFDHPRPAGLDAALATALAERVGLVLTVMVRSGDEIAAVLAERPFGERTGEAGQHIGFLAGAPTPDADARLAALAAPGEAAVVSDRHVHVLLPLGAGRSKLAARLESVLVTPVTLRNRATVGKLAGLTAG